LSAAARLIQLGHDALGEQRDDAGYAEFGRLLDDVIHRLRLGHGLQQSDGARQWGRKKLLLHDQSNGALGYSRDFTGESMPCPVEHGGSIAGFETQDAQGVMRFAVRQLQRGVATLLGWQIEAVHRDLGLRFPAANRQRFRRS
jgi:hypothetical protein